MQTNCSRYTKLDVLLEKVTALERQFRATRVPRDRADAALLEGLLALADARAGTFRASALIRHGELVPAFKQLLLDADVETSVDAGYWLRRFRGHVVNGRRLESTDRAAAGAIWGFVAA